MRRFPRIATHILGGPDGHTPIEEPDIMAWAQWFGDRRQAVVASEELPEFGVWVSTVFTGLDRAYPFHTRPVHIPELFETAIFSLQEPRAVLHSQGHSATWDEALGVHNEVVARVRSHGVDWMP